MIKKVAAVAAATGGLVLAGAGMAVADAGAHGAAAHSPGVLSGNVVQAPVHIPVNACGNSVSVIGLLNSAFGNTCANV
ncbi:chaplin [Streptomyces sp. NBC_00344]|uniref:chaplin n=1 Tax=Streptomyces sp. NBC_00344 TaxID=2975720 RepID=UPI002E22121D